MGEATDVIHQSHSFKRLMYSVMGEMDAWKYALGVIKTINSLISFLVVEYIQDVACNHTKHWSNRSCILPEIYIFIDFV